MKLGHTARHERARGFAAVFELDRESNSIEFGKEFELNYAPIVRCWLAMFGSIIGNDAEQMS